MRKGEAVHAVVLGWPEDNVARLKLWSLDNPIGRGEIRRVTLPGQDRPLQFRRTESALEIDLPPELPLMSSRFLWQVSQDGRCKAAGQASTR